MPGIIADRSKDTASHSSLVRRPVSAFGWSRLSALSLAIVEFIYVFKRVISPIYLGDAFVELILIAWWFFE